jgi:hypothetical protein
MTRTPGYVIVSTLVVWASIGVAAWALWPVYQSPRFLVLLAAGLLTGALVAIPAALLRWPSPVVLLLTALVFFAIGVPVAVPDKALSGILPTPGGLLDLVSGVALGWRQLLTISTPVGDYQALLVPALVLVLVGTVVALSIALRARRPELAALVPLVVFGLAIAFGPSVQARPIEVPIGLLVIVLLWLVWLRWQRRTAAVRALSEASGTPVQASTAVGVRSLLAAAAILAVVSVSAVGAAIALPPSAERTVLRTTMQIPFDPRSVVSPLSGFRAFWQEPMADELLLTVGGLPAGSLLRVATLDTYDGVVYSVGTAEITAESGSFTRVPSDVDQSGVAGDRVTLEVSVEGYTGIWLPTAGRLERIEFAGPRADELGDAFYYNGLTGAAVDTTGLAAGDDYTLAAVLPQQPGRSQLSSLTPGSAIVPTPRDVPEELTARLEEYVRGVDGQGERLGAMLDGLARDGYISHGIGADEAPSRSGHAADRLAQLVTDPIMIGDAEQYAVSAALMAGDLGFPARVVLGFVPEDGEVHGRDVTAWIEVDTAEYGWVAIDPNPEVRDIPEELPEENDAVSRPQTIVPPPVVENESFDRQLTPDSAQEDQSGLDPFLTGLFAVLRVTGWVLAALALIAAPFLAVIAAKVRRRRLRRTAGSVAARINGGWKEFEDAVADHGRSPSPNATRSEIAATVGRAQADVLAAVADHAMFSPDPLHEPEAESVWRVVDELTESLDEDLTWWQRLRARVSVRSLGGLPVLRRKP